MEQQGGCCETLKDLDNELANLDPCSSVEGR